MPDLKRFDYLRALISLGLRRTFSNYSSICTYGGTEDPSHLEFFLSTEMAPDLLSFITQLPTFEPQRELDHYIACCHNFLRKHEYNHLLNQG